MSSEVTKRQCLACLSLPSNSSVSKQRSLKILVILSTRDVKAAFSEMSRETVRDKSSILARLSSLVDVSGRNGDFDVK